MDNNCHINAQCINTKYSFHCACLEGYHGTGVKCEQIAKSVVAEKGKSVDGQSESGTFSSKLTILYFLKFFFDLRPYLNIGYILEIWHTGNTQQEYHTKKLV